MKKTTVSVPYDDEKLSALKMFLAKKEMDLESEMTGFIDKLYGKYVSNDVKEYISGRYGSDSEAKS